LYIWGKSFFICCQKFVFFFKKNDKFKNTTSPYTTILCLGADILDMKKVGQKYVKWVKTASKNVYTSCMLKAALFVREFAENGVYLGNCSLLKKS